MSDSNEEGREMDTISATNDRVWAEDTFTTALGEMRVEKCRDLDLEEGPYRVYVSPDGRGVRAVRVDYCDAIGCPDNRATVACGWWSGDRLDLDAGLGDELFFEVESAVSAMVNE